MIPSTHDHDWWHTLGSLVIPVAFVGMFAFLLFSIRPAMTPAPSPKFYAGDMVRMKVSQQSGMVVKSYCRKGVEGGRAGYCVYDVRFAAFQARTQTHTFGSDGPIDVAPVALVHNIREFELERVR